MNISNMELGQQLYLGNLIWPLRFKADASVDLVWTKVSSDNHFTLNLEVAPCMMMDQREPNSKSRARRYGNAFFPQTALYQWLNASESGWYVPFGDDDTQPPYSDHSGFLSSFTKDEKSALQVQKITCVVPIGHRATNGNKVSVECLVSIPSASQINYEPDQGLREEGGMFEYYKMHRVMDEIFLRTPVESRVSIACVRKGTMRIYPVIPSSMYKVIPVIQLKPDVEIKGDGEYFCLAPTSEAFTNSEMEAIWAIP